MTDHHGSGAGLDGEASERPDPIEVLGRRIGRALSYAGAATLALWFGRQAGWW